MHITLTPIPIIMAMNIIKYTHFKSLDKENLNEIRNAVTDN